MQKIEVVVRITKDHCPPQEQTIFEWFDLMRNPTDALRSPSLEINLEHHRVFKHGTEVYMSRYEYGVLSLMAQHPGKLFTKEQIFEAVWHKDSDSYLRAVTSTIGRIRQKIEDDKDHPRYSKAFLEAHREEIALHKAAKAAFDEAGLQKLPKVKELDAEFAELLTKKKAAYPDYRKARNEMQELVRARKNVERFFAEEKGTTEKTQIR